MLPNTSYQKVLLVEIPCWPWDFWVPSLFLISCFPPPKSKISGKWIRLFQNFIQEFQDWIKIESFQDCIKVKLIVCFLFKWLIQLLTERVIFQETTGRRKQKQNYQTLSLLTPRQSGSEGGNCCTGAQTSQGGRQRRSLDNKNILSVPTNDYF